MDISIPASRKRFPIILIPGLILCAALGYLVVHTWSDHGMNSSFNFLYICCLISASYYTLLSVTDYFKTMFDSEARLLVTDEGITDNLGILSCGYISWMEIAGVRMQTILKSAILVIDVANPDLLIQKQPAWKHPPLKSYLRKFGSPVIITQKKSRYKLSDLKFEIEAKLAVK